MDQFTSMKMHFYSDFIYKECPEAVCYIKIAESFQKIFER